MEQKETILKRKFDYYGSTEAAIHFAMDEFASNACIEFATFIRLNHFVFSYVDHSWYSSLDKWKKESYSTNRLFELFKYEINF